ncbi:MAG: hypothetical protein EOS78_02635 [Mesorhizobium sp.]|nr:MAG: hypothetical protein EOS78_02635 [Mesorhizobium sp.]
MQREGEQGQGSEAAGSEVAGRLEQETQAAREAFDDARDDLTAKAGDYVSEAGQALLEKAKGAQHDISSNLKAVGGALRAASEHLANADQKIASKFALDASDGVERLSSSLKDKPFRDVLNDVRSFGRENSAALIAGSLLAGLALGRFLKSSPPAGSAEHVSPGGGSSSLSRGDTDGETGEDGQPAAFRGDWMDERLEDSQ